MTAEAFYLRQLIANAFKPQSSIAALVIVAWGTYIVARGTSIVTRGTSIAALVIVA